MSKELYELAKIILSEGKAPPFGKKDEKKDKDVKDDAKGDKEVSEKPEGGDASDRGDEARPGDKKAPADGAPEKDGKGKPPLEDDGSDEDREASSKDSPVKDDSEDDGAEEVDGGPDSGEDDGTHKPDLDVADGDEDGSASDDEKEGVDGEVGDENSDEDDDDETDDGEPKVDGSSKSKINLKPKLNPVTPMDTNTTESLAAKAIARARHLKEIRETRAALGKAAEAWADQVLAKHTNVLEHFILWNENDGTVSVVAEVMEENGIVTRSLDEISKKTLGGYAKRAAGELEAQSFFHGHHVSVNDYTKPRWDARRKSKNRAEGIRKAVDRLTKEDVEPIYENSRTIEDDAHEHFASDKESEHHISLEKKGWTPRTKHHVEQQHDLVLRTKSPDFNTWTSRLIDHHGGDGDNFRKTGYGHVVDKDGNRHHFSASHGTHHSVYTYSKIKPHVKEDVDDEEKVKDSLGSLRAQRARNHTAKRRPVLEARNVDYGKLADYHGRAAEHHENQEGEGHADAAESHASAAYHYRRAHEHANAREARLHADQAERHARNAEDLESEHGLKRLEEVYKSPTTLAQKMQVHNSDARGFMRHRDSIPGALNKAKRHLKASHLAAKAHNKKVGLPEPLEPDYDQLDKGNNPFSGKKDDFRESVEIEEGATPAVTPKPKKEIKTGNEGYGFHGTAYNAHGRNGADKEYAKMHRHVKKVTGNKNDEKVKHFLDSRAGRHLGDQHYGTHVGASHNYIKKEFERFSKDYDPADHQTSTIKEETIDEGLRLLKTHTEGPHSAKVYKDTEWGEHRVKFFTDGKHRGEKEDYHTDDPEDAHDTAKAVLKRLGEGLEVDEDIKACISTMRKRLADEHEEWKDSKRRTVLRSAANMKGQADVSAPIKKRKNKVEAKLAMAEEAELEEGKVGALAGAATRILFPQAGAAIAPAAEYVADKAADYIGKKAKRYIARTKARKRMAARNAEAQPVAEAMSNAKAGTVAKNLARSHYDAFTKTRTENPEAADHHWNAHLHFNRASEHYSKANVGGAEKAMDSGYESARKADAVKARNADSGDS